MTNYFPFTNRTLGSAMFHQSGFDPEQLHKLGEKLKKAGKIASYKVLYAPPTIQRRYQEKKRYKNKHAWSLWGWDETELRYPWQTSGKRVIKRRRK